MMNENVTFKKEVLEAEKPVVVEFWAPWCGYCRRLAPAVDRLEKELGDAVVIRRSNVDEEPEIAKQYQVDTIPSLILFQNGKASERLVNPPSQSAISQWLKENGAL